MVEMRRIAFPVAAVSVLAAAAVGADDPRISLSCPGQADRTRAYSVTITCDLPADCTPVGFPKLVLIDRRTPAPRQVGLLPVRMNGDRNRKPGEQARGSRELVLRPYPPGQYELYARMEFRDGAGRLQTAESARVSMRLSAQ
jgi:hypothetical protein